MKAYLWADPNYFEYQFIITVAETEEDARTKAKQVVLDEMKPTDAPYIVDRYERWLVWIDELTPTIVDVNEAKIIDHGNL